MKVTYRINFVCSSRLNSTDNIDFEFKVESSYLPTKTCYLGGIFVVVEESNYDVATDEGIVYASCYYPKNKAVNEVGQVNVELAQNETYRLIALLSDRFGIKGTYTKRATNCALDER